MSGKSARKQHAIFRQVCELIPSQLVSKLSRVHGIQSRTFNAWSHVVSLLHAQMTHAIGLNDVSDSLKANRSLLASIRGATPPSRNGFSHANRTRNASMAEDLFWSTLSHLQSLDSGFGGKKFKKLPRRFKRTIHAIDSSTIKLFSNCIDWAKHRRRKAAAKLHLRLNLETFLPSFAIVDSAKGHDNKKAYELCYGLQSGEIVVFDMAYIDYTHLLQLTERKVFWVSRVKDNMKFRCVKKSFKKPTGKTLSDDIIIIESKLKRKDYPKKMRRVTAIVEINGKEIEMSFFTNNMQWAASSICDLYKSRWNIETFFKQIKQTLHIGDFLGHNKNAVQWQVWTALLLYVLLRFLHTASKWNHSFIRLFTCLRAVIWQRRNLIKYLKSYGTAGGCFKLLCSPQQAYLPGFEKFQWDST